MPGSQIHSNPSIRSYFQCETPANLTPVIQVVIELKTAKQLVMAFLVGSLAERCGPAVLGASGTLGAQNPWMDTA